MTTTSTAKPKLNRLDDRDGMERYQVTLDGQVIGTVEQHTYTTVTPYSGKMYGFPRTRKAWQWTDESSAGDFELRSRKAAVDGLVEFVTAAR